MKSTSKKSLFAQSQWQTFIWLFTISFIYELGESWQNTGMTLFTMACCLFIMSSKEERVRAILFTMLAFLLFVLGFWFPVVANHVNLQLFTIIMVLLFAAREFKGGSLKLIFAQQTFGLCLVATYFMSAVHKLNFDFFDSQFGCTTWMYSKANNWLNLGIIESMPQWFFTISPYIYVGVLFSATIALLLPGLYRAMGLITLFSLHSFLAFIGFADFSSICFSFYVLFIPKKIWNKSFKGYRLWNFMPVEKWYSCWAFLMALFTALSFRFSLFERTHYQGLFLLVGVFPLAYLFVRSLKDKKSKYFWKTQKSLLSGVKWKALVPAVLIVVFALSPYMGLRSKGTFTMFSNLKVEGGSNNHILIPQWDLFPFLKNIVWIKRLDGQQGPSYGLNEIDFRRQVMVDYEERWLKQKKPLSVVIDYQGKEYIYKNVFVEDLWIQELPWYIYFLDFRSIQVDQNNPNRCRL